MSVLAIRGGTPVISPDEAPHPWPQIEEVDRQAVLAAMDDASPWRWPFPVVTELEQAWADFCGMPHVVAANSGTAALHMAVAAAGVKPGDEVIVPADTFLASASCVLHANAIPVFADVDPVNGNIDPDAVAAAVTDRTKAVIAVDLHGLPANYRAIRTAVGPDRVIIEDGAQAHGATYFGEQVGSLGDISASSIHGAKNLSALGEGGLFAARSQEHRSIAAKVMMFGEDEAERVQDRTYESSMMGWNYRIDVLAAAFARSQLKRLPQQSQVRQDNAEYLTRLLSQIEGISLPVVPEGSTHAYFYLPILLSPEAFGVSPRHGGALRDEAVKALQAEGLSAIAWQRKPLPEQRLFTERIGYGRGCPWSCAAADGWISTAPQEYPSAQRICNTRIILGTTLSSLGPPNGHREMERYAECIDKVLNQNRHYLVERAKEEAAA